MIRLSEFGIGKVEAVYQFLLDITIMLWAHNFTQQKVKNLIFTVHKIIENIF